MPSLVLLAVPGNVSLLVADVAGLFLLLALACNVAHLAAVVARHFIWAMLAVLGDVSSAVAAITPVLSLLAVPGEVAYPIALVALFSDGRLVIHAATGGAAASSPWSPTAAHATPAPAPTAAILEALASKVSQLVALVALRGGTHSPPLAASSTLDSLLAPPAPRRPPAAAPLLFVFSPRSSADSHGVGRDYEGSVPAGIGEQPPVSA